MPTAAPLPPAEQGGDPACWLHRVCPECGRLATAPLPATCEVCGTTIAGEDD